MHSVARQTFPRSDRAPGDARRYVAGLLSAWQIAHRCPAALLALSELVTNAVTHGRGFVKVRVALRPSVLRIEVEDDGPGLHGVTRRAPAGDGVGGRGLHIVDRVVEDWGYGQLGADRSVVWFETLCPE
jgi:anti-sigma regulatory factor (Ser/Thr protein kinase)